MFPAPVVPFIRYAEHKVQPPWRLRDRRLLDYLLLGLESGACTLIVEGVRHDLVPGDLVLIQPGELNSWHAPVATTTPFAHFDIFYNAHREDSFTTPPGRTDLSGLGHLLQPRLNDLPGIHIPTRFRLPPGGRIVEAFHSMVTLAQSTNPLDRLQAQGLATEVIALLLREFSAPSRSITTTPSLHWLTSYMSLQLGEQLSVGELADRAHLSPSRFAAVFKEQFGVPPHAYLTRLRVEHARSLLHSTAAGLSDIAMQCGFANVPHFIRAFRRLTGTTPGQCRAVGNARTERTA